MMTEGQFKAILADHTKDLIKTVEKSSAASAKDAVNTTLTSLGIDVSNPIETQQDFAWVRNSREATNSVKKRTIMVVVGVVVTFVAGCIVAGLKSFFGA